MTLFNRKTRWDYMLAAAAAAAADRRVRRAAKVSLGFVAGAFTATAASAAVSSARHQDKR